MMKLLVFLICSCFAYALHDDAEAARLFIATNRPAYMAGQVGEATLLLDTQGASANAVAAAVVYDPAAVEVTRIITDKSIFGVWARKPALVAINGWLGFQGAILNPGYRGTSGRLLAFQFKAKKAGSVSFEPKDSTVFANDGKATRLTLKSEKKSFPVIAAGPYVTVSSKSNPDQRVWYRSTMAMLSWTKEKDVAGLAFAFNRTAIAEPPTSKFAATTSATYKNLASGSWFAHVKPKHAAYGWLPTVHYRINIDNEAPALAVTTKRLNQSFLPVITATATDRFSGLKWFEVWVNGVKVIENPTGVLKDFKPNKFNAGNNAVDIIAYDRLGNKGVKKLTFAFRPIK